MAISLYNLPMWAFYVGEAVGALLLFTFGLFLYRVYFHPLSRVPGPKLAATTIWFEHYYDLVAGRQWPWKIREMHKKYGPVVRVNPREVHIQDSDFFEKLFVQRLDKDPWFSKSFAVPGSAFGTSSASLHRRRRGALNKYFSKASIASRIDMVEEKISKLCQKLEEYHKEGEVVHLDAGFICLTVDVISQMAFGRSWNYLDISGFDKEWKNLMEVLFSMGGLVRAFPWMALMMNVVPVSMLKVFIPTIANLHRVREMCAIQIRRVLAQREKATEKPAISEKNTADDLESSNAATNKATIFDQILDSPLPADEKDLERLIQEGQTLMGAGSETTGRALYLSAVHLLSNPEILARLRAELDTVMPTTTSKPQWSQLERLPYLTAVIKEAVRVSGSVVTRLSRMSTEEQPITYGDWTFPPGTPVSVTPHDVLFDAKIFPDPEKFDPMRWVLVEQGADGQETLKPNVALDKYMVAFSRGPRQCVGMWIAWAELYLTIAHVYRRFEMQLFETDVSDVAGVRDCFTCFARKDSKGVRVKVTGVRDT